MVKKGNKVLALSVSEDQIVELKRMASEAGMTLSGFMIKVAFEAGPLWIESTKNMAKSLYSRELSHKKLGDPMPKTLLERKLEQNEIEKNKDLFDVPAEDNSTDYTFPTS